MLSSIYPVSVTVRDGKFLVNKITTVSTCFFVVLLWLVFCVDISLLLTGCKISRISVPLYYYYYCISFLYYLAVCLVIQAMMSLQAAVRNKL